MLRPICWFLSAYYSLRYWFRGGVLSFSVDGHSYVEMEPSDGEVDGQPVVWLNLRCERCGAVSRAWTPSYATH